MSCDRDRGSVIQVRVLLRSPHGASLSYRHLGLAFFALLCLETFGIVFFTPNAIYDHLHELKSRHERNESKFERAGESDP